MMISETIQNYGYFTIFVVSIFEGEPVLILSGIAAQRGLIDMRAVVFLTFLSAVASDSMFFLIGKYKGMRWLEKSKIAQKIFSKPHRFLSHNPRKMSFSLRFMYGLRNVIPFSLGTTDLSYRTFFLYNTASAAVWALMFGAIGYYVGDVAKDFFADFGLVQYASIFGIFILGTMIHLLFNYVKRRFVAKKIVS